MSILIRGMEMPEGCGVCPFKDDECFGAWKCWRVKDWGDDDNRAKDCPLVEILPHGDLIGREWLIDIALHLMNTAKNDDVANGVKWLLQYIIDSTTIIEAEEGE